MDSKTIAVLEIIKGQYELFEKELLEKLKTVEKYCRVGAPFAVDITWTQNEDQNNLQMRAYGGGVQLRKGQEQTQDVMFMNKGIIQTHIIPELKQFIKKRMEAYEFGSLYAPSFQGEVNFWLGKPVNYANGKFTVKSLDKQKQAETVYREVWLSEEYKTWDFQLNNYCAQDAYGYLINSLAPEIGNKEVIKRLDCILERHRLEVEAAGKSCGTQKYRRKYLLKEFKNYACTYGFLDPYERHGKKEATPEVLELLLYMGIALVRYEDEFSNDGKPLIKELAKKKYKPAKQCLDIGTGAISEEDAVWKSDLATCMCNDIFKTVTLKLKEENEETYKYMLEYMLHIMECGFTPNYKINFNSKEKNLIPVKSLRKSATHKFWANCAAYENLHPMIETYIRKTMEDTWFYSDGPEDDETPMATGGYAMLALAFMSPKYGDLFAEYLDTNKRYDHNVFDDKTIELYLKTWGVTPQTMGAALECAEWHRALNPKKANFAGFKDVEVLKKVNELETIKKGSLESMVDYVWGGADHLEKAVQAATGEEQAELQKVLHTLSSN